MIAINPRSGTLEWNGYRFYPGLPLSDLPMAGPNRCRIAPIPFDGRDHELILFFVADRLTSITFQPDLGQFLGDDNDLTEEEVRLAQEAWEQDVEPWRKALATWLEARFGKAHQVAETHSCGLESGRLEDWTYYFSWGQIFLARGFLDTCHHIAIIYALSA